MKQHHPCLVLLSGSHNRKGRIEHWRLTLQEASRFGKAQWPLTNEQRRNILFCRNGPHKRQCRPQLIALVNCLLAVTPTLSTHHSSVGHELTTQLGWTFCLGFLPTWNISLYYISYITLLFILGMSISMLLKKKTCLIQNVFLFI